jgi:hypothetical protein
MTKHCGRVSAMQDPASLFTATISWGRSLPVGVVGRSAIGRSGGSYAGLWMWASENSSSTRFVNKGNKKGRGCYSTDHNS